MLKIFELMPAAWLFGDHTTKILLCLIIGLIPLPATSRHIMLIQPLPLMVSRESYLLIPIDDSSFFGQQWLGLVDFPADW